jgi:hypothetical protein
VRKEILAIMQEYVDEGFVETGKDIESHKFKCAKCRGRICKGTGQVADCRHTVHKSCKGSTYSKFKCSQCSKKGGRNLSTIASSIKELGIEQARIKKRKAAEGTGN